MIDGCFLTVADWSTKVIKKGKEPEQIHDSNNYESRTA